ncbi:MAG: hypothetical protein ABI824_05405 [Acidobacteriota bacterium]
MTQLSYQLGGVLFLACAILLLSFCRDLLSRETRDAIKKIGMVGIAALLIYAGVHADLLSPMAAMHAVFGSSQPTSQPTATQSPVPTPAPAAQNRRRVPRPTAKVTDAEYQFLTQPPPTLHLSVPASQPPDTHR